MKCKCFIVIASIFWFCVLEFILDTFLFNIINLSETEDLVTVMTCNEVFDPKRPDTFREIV